MYRTTSGYSVIRVLHRLQSYSGKYLIGFVVLFGLAISSSLLTVANAVLFRRIINAVVNTQHGVFAGLIVLGLTITVGTFFTNFCNALVGTIVQNRSSLALQSLMLDKALRLRSESLDKYHSADIARRMIDCVNIAMTGLNTNLVQIVASLLQIVFLITYLSVVNLELSIGTILFAIAIPLITTPLAKPLRSAYDARQRATASTQAVIQDAIQGIETVKTLGMGKFVLDRLHGEYEKYLKVHLRAVKIESAIYRLQLLVWVGGALFILGYGGYLVVKHRLDVGAIAGYVIAFQSLSVPLQTIGQLWTHFQDSLSNANSIFEVLDLPDEPKHSDNPRREQLLLGVTREMYRQIHFKGVTFAYIDGEPVLNNIDISLCVGKVTALIGPSGAGKSTIVSLLLRLYEPQNGAIYMDETPVTSFDLTEWRAKLSLVPQDSAVFSGTFADNIRLGCPTASDMEVRSAANAANIHDFIENTPKGYETTVGERGQGLSGGQRQRLAIARAFLRNPDLLILDEPTSALDSENEQLVEQAVTRVMRNRTTIIIAHRLASIRNADNIIFVDSGSVIETGSHDQLMSLKGRYYAYYNSGSAI